jgi:hypothetical protein
MKVVGDHGIATTDQRIAVLTEAVHALMTHHQMSQGMEG